MSFEILGKAYLYANVAVGQILFFKPYQMFFLFLWEFAFYIGCWFSMGSYVD